MATKNKFILFPLLFFGLILIGAVPSFPVTTVGTSIESKAELHYDLGVVISETIVTTVEQMYGITIEPTARYANGFQWITYYFSHTLTNLGNGSDYIRFRFNASTMETWSCALIKDDDNNTIHETTEVTTFDALPISEDGMVRFFVAVTAPTNESNGACRYVNLIATGEGRDGSYYIGADGTIYGGPDTAEVTDTLTVESTLKLKINRDDVTGKIFITWNGDTADIYYIEGTYEATFSAATTEDVSVSSPYYCTVEAKDGKTRYYRIKLTGRSSLEDTTLGKFDVPVRVGMNELSYPLIRYSGTPASMVGRQVTGARNIVDADRIWKYSPTTVGSYEIAWLVGGVGPSSDGLWYTGVSPTSMVIGTDEGFVLEIRSGHPATYITMIGEVSKTNRSVPISTGMNFVGTCFPLEVTLEGSNLWQSGMKGGRNAADADRVWKYSPTVVGSYEVAWLVDGVGPSYNGKWYTGNSLTKLTLKPGYGYRVEIRASHAPFTWDYKKPY